MVPKIIKGTIRGETKGLKNKNKFHNFSNSIKNASYVWQYGIKSEMEMMLHEIDQIYFPYIGLKCLVYSLLKNLCLTDLS